MSYFDHNATSPLLPQVVELLSHALQRQQSEPGNPSSIHRGGRAARRRLDAARQSVANILGAQPREICFTGSGSEANALALHGAFRARRDLSRKQVVLSAIEHPALLLAADQLQAAGAEIIRLPPGPDGQVSLEALSERLTTDVSICSLMWANNETGVLQPAREAARLCRERGIVFHTDAVQAVGKVEVSLRHVDADLLSLSAHKFGGPAGVGALVVRRGVSVSALVAGHQEDGKRGGTPSVPLIEALALALELSHNELEPTSRRLLSLREHLEAQVLQHIPEVVVNGGGSPRAPNTSNLQFAGADAEALLISLDLAGVCVSTGAACASGSLSPSHVLTAMGLSPAQAHGSLRISMGPSTTRAEVEELIDLLVHHVPKAREAARLGAM